MDIFNSQQIYLNLDWQRRNHKSELLTDKLKLAEYTFTLDKLTPLEFYGVNNQRFLQVKEAYPQLDLVARGNELRIVGAQENVDRLLDILSVLIKEKVRRGEVTEERFSELLLSEQEKTEQKVQEFTGDEIIVHGSKGNIVRARTSGQQRLFDSTKVNDIVFAIGPAGTGKTYTAVAIAVKALKEKRVKKIFLVRPAVEAGENLGFLPGDLKEKVDPYLRPLYDALDDMLHHEKVKGYIERNTIEIVPLAYMRGRTLSNAYVILDESQNATEMQFKMFLTRMGKESKLIITGDDTQIDLPKRQRSGLIQSVRLLEGIKGIGIVRLSQSDVVRHKLVKKIIEAYQKEDSRRDDGRG